MPVDRPVPCDDPAISAAMATMLEALDSDRDGSNASALALRSAHLVGTVRRCLTTGKPRNLHCDLRLVSAIEDYERRWNSSALIKARFGLFQRDSRRFLSVLRQRLGAGPNGEIWSTGVAYTR